MYRKEVNLMEIMKMIGPKIDFIFEAARVYWTRYDQYKAEFKEIPLGEIEVLMEERGSLERMASYVPFSVSQARKNAARDRLGEK